MLRNYARSPFHVYRGLLLGQHAGWHQEIGSCCPTEGELAGVHGPAVGTSQHIAHRNAASPERVTEPLCLLLTASRKVHLDFTVPAPVSTQVSLLHIHVSMTHQNDLATFLERGPEPFVSQRRACCQ